MHSRVLPYPPYLIHGLGLDSRTFWPGTIHALLQGAYHVPGTTLYRYHTGQVPGTLQCDEGVAVIVNTYIYIYTSCIIYMMHIIRVYCL